MKKRLMVIPAMVLCVGVFAAVFPGTTAGEVRSRALARIVAEGSYSADEGARLERAFAAAVRAGVRERDALSLVESCVDGEFEAAQVERVLSVAAQLALERLPVEGFLAKIEEGVSKRVDSALVVQAAERRGLTLKKAQSIVKALILDGLTVDDADELLADLAAALEAGRSPEEAREILAEALRAGDSAGSIRRKLFP